MPKQLVFKIKERFGDTAFQFQERTPKVAYLAVHKSDLRFAVGVLFEEFRARFLTASGIDNVRNFEILYHFSFDNLNKIISIRTFVEKDSPVIDSIVPVIGAPAEWIEREIHEFFGIYFSGHPGLKHLLLPQDWPQGQYPLKKDYEQNINTNRKPKGLAR